MKVGLGLLISSGESCGVNPGWGLNGFGGRCCRERDRMFCMG